MDFIQYIQNKAKKIKKNIILPEIEDERVLRAASFIQKEKIAQITLLGEEKDIRNKFNDLNLQHSGINFLSLDNNVEKYTELILKINKKDGISKKTARDLLKNKLCYGCIAVRSGDADGMVAGASFTTADVFKNAIRYVGTQSKNNTVSGIFIAILNKKIVNLDTDISPILGLADCAINPNPTADQLASIAIDSASTMQKLTDIDPVVAMLSFSTKGSSTSPLIKKVTEATQIAKKLKPELKLDGELQLDTALIQSVAKLKAPKSNVAGNANILIFPDLNSGNISYKIIQRIGCAKVIGPILQGLQFPVNDLSRGCDVEEIQNAITITALQSEI